VEVRITRGERIGGEEDNSHSRAVSGRYRLGRPIKSTALRKKRGGISGERKSHHD